MGGLTATIGGTTYFLHYTGRVDLRQLFGKHVDRMDRVDIKITRKPADAQPPRKPWDTDTVRDSDDSDDSLWIPMPLLLPLLGWYVAQL